VTQVPTRRNRDTGIPEEVFDTSLVNEHGEKIVIFPDGHTGNLIHTLHEKVDYNYDCGDCILLLGSNYLIALTIMHVFCTNDAITLLRWDNTAKNYRKVLCSLDAEDAYEPE
jgi:hypothetical protein